MVVEYESLRQEILAWQNRRFMILTASITLVSAILGFDVVQQKQVVLEWSLITSLLWFFLGSTAALTSYAGVANARIAAYLLVFYEKEGGWESCLKMGQNKPNKIFLDQFNLNKMIFLIYAGLGLLSLVIPWSIRYSQVQAIECWPSILLFITGVWFLVILLLLLWGDPKPRYIKKWEIVKSQLHNKNSERKQES